MRPIRRSRSSLRKSWWRRNGRALLLVAVMVALIGAILWMLRSVPVSAGAPFDVPASR